MQRKKIKVYLILNLILMLYSTSGILSKFAAGEPILSIRFCILYSGMLVLLAVYAFAWQQIIKKMSLTAAFANKAVTVVWGLVWGTLFFHERISAGKVCGAALVICGVVLYAIADNKQEKSDG